MELERQNPPLHLPKDTVPRRYMDVYTYVDIYGYIWEACPTHPKCLNGMIVQHRIIVECALGRFLKKLERVHHKNHQRWDNRLDNLVVYDSQKEHMLDHWQTEGRRSQAWIEKVRQAASDPAIGIDMVGMSPTTVWQICKEHDIEWIARKHKSSPKNLTDDIVHEALQGRTTHEAAAFLGVAFQTLHKRFSHLLHKRTSPGYLDQFQEEILHLAYKECWSHRELAERYHVSQLTVAHTIQRWSKQDGAMGALALLQIRRGRRKHMRKRRESDMAHMSPLPPLGLLASGHMPLPESLQSA